MKQPELKPVRAKRNPSWLKSNKDLGEARLHFNREFAARDRKPFDEVHALTKEQAVTCPSMIYHRWKRNADGTALRVRSTGKCQVWKTRPDEFKLPVKYGMYESGYITHANASEWSLVEPLHNKLTVVQPEKPSQYAVWYDGMVIEHTGYIATLAAAKKFVRERYTNNGEGCTIQKCYPVREETKHKV